MAWGLIAMAAVSAVGSIVASRSASAQNETQASWNRYNAQMGYDVNMSNIQSQVMLGMYNAQERIKTAKMNADATMDVAEFNVGQLEATVAYNNSLLEEEERLLWEAADLDVTLLEQQRKRERGEIIAAQSYSGTTLGYETNADVVADQMAQEAMDTFVIRHNANIGASKISNAIAQNTWQGKMQAQKIMYEGRMGSAMMVNNAYTDAKGTLISTALGAEAGQKSAEYQLSSGLSGASMQFDANQMQISNNLAQGLFSSAAQAYKGYSATRPVVTTSTPTGLGSLMDSKSTNPGNIMGGF